MVLTEVEKPNTIAVAISDDLESARHRITTGETTSLAPP
jgi:hypothetical protein